MANIAIFIPSLSYGGAERVMATLANRLQKTGHTVFFILLEDRVDYSITEGINVSILDKKSLPKNNYKKQRQLLQKHLSDIEQKFSMTFDVLFSNLFFCDRIASYITNLNVFAIIHSTMSIKTRIQRKKGLGRWNLRRKYKRFYKKLNIICVSQGVADDFTKNFVSKPKSIRVIHNPFNFSEIKEKANLYIPDIDNYILHVGRFSLRIKRQDRLIDAYNAASLGNTKLVLLGQGPDKERIQDMITKCPASKQVIIRDFTSNPYPWIKHAKLLVLSSDFEGFGNVLVEALILETPVVSTDCPVGPSEILTGEFVRGIAKNGSLKDLTSKIEDVLNNPYDIADTSLQKFNDKYIVGKYLELIT